MAVADKQGFASFHAAAYPRLVAQLLAVTGNLQEAEDVVQEAFARASVRWDRLCAYQVPEARVRRVAYNLAVSGLRRARLDALLAHQDQRSGSTRQPPRS
jgi:RNA polymerase sigma-70 factor (ECF subfamily)